MSPRSRLFSSLALAICAFGASSLALAQDEQAPPDHYIEGGVAGGRITGGNISVAEVFAGYQFNQIVASELNYDYVDTKNRAEISHFTDLSALLFTPEAGRVRAFARVGAALSTTLIPGDDRKQELSSTYGLGVEVRVLGEIAIRGQWQQVHSFANTVSNVNFATLGLVAHFR